MGIEKTANPLEELLRQPLPTLDGELLAQLLQALDEYVDARIDQRIWERNLASYRDDY